MFDRSSRDTNLPSGGPRRPVRYWPVLTILLLAMGAAFWVRSSYGRQRQDQNIAIANVVVITSLLLLLWCLFFSRLRWKIRLGVLAAIVAAGVLMPVGFRIHGVTGDLVPILEWRWQHRALAPLADSPQASRSPAAESRVQFTNDYPQFLGPNRNSTLDQPRLARDWKAQPPRRLWIQPVGTGWSGFAIVGTRAITEEQRGENEAVVCYDLLSGAVHWSYAYS